MLLVASMAVIPLVVALAISLSQAKPSILLTVALLAGAIAIVALITNKRLEVSVLLLAIYLGLLEGPVKLGTGGHELASVVRDVLIYAVALGAVMRLLARKEGLHLPPLSGWVVAFVTLVLIEGLNPNTLGFTKALGGYRQQLEWVPFFFFGFALMRSKRRFRQLFLLFGVLALANGIVSTYQTRLSPTQLATWGPGYRELVFGTEVTGVKGGLAGRFYGVEGTSHIRPPALGTDAGTSGGMGVLALAGLLALLATLRWRRRWPIVVLILGALAGIATGEGRLQVVGAVLVALAFIALSFSAGKSVTRPLLAVLAVIVIALPLGSVFVSSLGSATFARYSSLSPSSISPQSKDTKLPSLSQIPKQLERAPFGVGLGEIGAATGFGGVATHEGIEHHGVSAETEYNAIADELGLPGLILWVSFTLRLLVLGFGGLRRISDVELRLYLAAMLATLIGFTLIGLVGPTMSSPAFGTFFWFTAGTFAYWFVTRRAQEEREKRVRGADRMLEPA
jgi:hypothetical protein